MGLEGECDRDRGTGREREREREGIREVERAVSVRRSDK